VSNETGTPALNIRTARPDNLSPKYPALDAHSVKWLQVTHADVAAYNETLKAAEDEKPLQRHLERHPMLLATHLGGGHGRFVLPQFSLDGRYVADFLIAEGDSDGLHWTLVELESPRVRLFTGTGVPRKELAKGLQQVSDWRRHIQENLDHARKLRIHGGLGLEDIEPQPPGIVVIGRERDLTDEDRERRKAIRRERAIAVHSYDWLAREASARRSEIEASAALTAKPEPS